MPQFMQKIPAGERRIISCGGGVLFNCELAITNQVASDTMHWLTRSQIEIVRQAVHVIS